MTVPVALVRSSTTYPRWQRAATAGILGILVCTGVAACSSTTGDAKPIDNSSPLQSTLSGATSAPSSVYPEATPTGTGGGAYALVTLTGEELTVTFDAMEAAIIPKKTRVIISESPTNPYLRIADLDRIAKLGKKHRILTMIDSTFATPVNQRPLEWGIDFVVHSATKYLSGHNDLLAGVVVGRADRIRALRDARGVLGGIVDPQNAYLLDRGIKTLGVRVQREDRVAMAIDE